MGVAARVGVIPTVLRALFHALAGRRRGVLSLASSCPKRVLHGPIAQVWGLLGRRSASRSATAHWTGILLGSPSAAGAWRWAARRTVAASPESTDELSAQGYLPFGVGLSIAAILLAYHRRLRASARDVRRDRTGAGPVSDARASRWSPARWRSAPAGARPSDPGAERAGPGSPGGQPAGAGGAGHRPPVHLAPALRDAEPRPGARLPDPQAGRGAAARAAARAGDDLPPLRPAARHAAAPAAAPRSLHRAGRRASTIPIPPCSSAWRARTAPS